MTYGIRFTMLPHSAVEMLRVMIQDTKHGMFSKNICHSAPRRHGVSFPRLCPPLPRGSASSPTRSRSRQGDRRKWPPILVHCKTGVGFGMFWMFFGQTNGTAEFASPQPQARRNRCKTSRVFPTFPPRFWPRAPKSTWAPRNHQDGPGGRPRQRIWLPSPRPFCWPGRLFQQCQHVQTKQFVNFCDAFCLWVSHFFLTIWLVYSL